MPNDPTPFLPPEMRLSALERRLTTVVECQSCHVLYDNLGTDRDGRYFDRPCPVCELDAQIRGLAMAFNDRTGRMA